MDPVISQAGESCGLSPQLIHSIFPSELTMWIDPQEVSYRIGENGSICVLYEFKEGVTSDPWRPNSQGKQQQQQQQQKKTNNAVVGSSGSSGSGSSSTSSSPTNDNEAVTNNAQTTTTATTATTCKDFSLRKMDYLLDPRKSVSIEQLAAYVSSG